MTTAEKEGDGVRPWGTWEMTRNQCCFRTPSQELDSVAPETPSVSLFPSAHLIGSRPKHPLRVCNWFDFAK